jgi:hypothetical protein
VPLGLLRHVGPLLREMEEGAFDFGVTGLLGLLPGLFFTQAILLGSCHIRITESHNGLFRVVSNGRQTNGKHGRRTSRETAKRTTASRTKRTTDIETDEYPSTAAVALGSAPGCSPADRGRLQGQLLNFFYVKRPEPAPDP